MVSITPILALVTTAIAQTKEGWAREKIVGCKALETQGNYKEEIRQAGLIMDQLYNGGDGSTSDIVLLRRMKAAVKTALQAENHAEIAIATARVYCPLPSTYLTFAINSLPQPIKDSHDTTLQAKYILFTMAMIHAESRFDRRALNAPKHKDGSPVLPDEIATGLGQLKPPTAREVLGDTDIDLTNPATNIQAVEAHVYRLFVAEFADHYPRQLMSFADDAVTTSVITTYGGAEPNKVLNLFGIYQLLYLNQVKDQLASQPFNQQ